ncbi:GNAT family N-acetyltransferase [Mesorhizobium sp. YR577]|uniref:GNAT family N-acetyltransferase n=1 Tax=Mesorhizobium sp. YR577 TaxID=1884373 RepID=UPI0008EED7A4|nr:GNAT family N-acetyltransferase [Mesorhizobium sp. YR577]SFU21729.1 Protein N-acetyltransferase, RimJ/RimL family [Mesorhizobium sp. YR577]
MITFRPMRSNEFPGYLDYFVPDYATEISTNYGLSSAAALAQAKREISEDLPDGADTPGQMLLCVIDDERGDDDAIGYLWYRPDKEPRSAFICDFHILVAHQGNGYGKLALSALEVILSDAGFEQIRLRVAADNERAHHVYKVGGFRATGINMSKRIGKV